jgi:sugar-specific transcriptional regulator TrmB
LSEESIKKVLKNFGATEKEAEVYIFLAKHGVLKGGEIVKQTKTHKALVYRILGSLQRKGLVESTLEAPARFTAVPFETILDLNIKAKQEEAAQIETQKKELLSYWKSISKTEPQLTLEKFTVIEGSHKIYPKISQMIKETKSQFSAISTVPGLVRADYFGLFRAAFDHPLKSKIQFRFLTELTNQNLDAMKALIRRTPKKGVSFKGKNPDLGLRLFPRMVIKDEQEIILFITPNADTSATEVDDVCLWTNSKALVRAFNAVFEDLWHNATDIKKKMAEIETGKPMPKIYVISDAEMAKKSYDDAISSAKEEIVVLTSSKGLVSFWENRRLVKDWANRSVSVRIMAPITSENLKAALQLLKYCAVRHVSATYLGTTIVDGQHLFQFKTSPPEKEKREAMPCFENTFYTNDSEYVEKTRIMLDDIWKSAPAPSTVTLESILGSVPVVVPADSIGTGTKTIKKEQWYGSAHVTVDKKPLGTERDLLKKVSEYQKDPDRNVALASTGQVIIHPPGYLNMPDLMIDCWHVRKESTFGESNSLIVSLWLNTPMGYAFVPVAIVETSSNPKLIAFDKAFFAGTPAGQNIMQVTDKELQVWKQGDSLFAGWTIQIALPPLSYSLPPSCLLFEAIGEARTQKYTTPTLPSGYRGTCEYTGFDAFVRFVSPTWKYAGPATEAVFGMNVVMTSIAP